MSLRLASLRTRLLSTRSYATTTEQQKQDPQVVTFSAPAKPRPYYARPGRDLPPLQRKWPTLLAIMLLGTSSWAAFYFFAANQERFSSSVMRQVMATIRDNPELQHALGDAIRPEPVWWLNGDPLVKGGIHLLQGHVDLSFRVKGHKGSGTLYFTSIRKQKGQHFQPLRFRVICDDGNVIDIPLRSMPA
ncbi:hypothetical protein EW026_g1081 [Hermanssonia centrifuga]|uniref:DUF1783-domain-containing protein n=1 Tax=Hermanssonia centrifuga TaxID=98765 RepID=A0A4S4KSS1_9APHY|nr:hypothetical protein EW026_g1081 [Hermanssonia centrifuga]